VSLAGRFCRGLCCLVTVPLLAASPPPVVAIYYHGNILTGVGLGNAGEQRATAIAVGMHEIVAVGDDATILRQKQPGTRLYDLKGAFVMPGINDAHVHLAAAGQDRLSVDLNGCTSLADMLGRVNVAAEHALPGQWLLGGGWDHTLWTNQTLPTRQDLDRVSRGHPAIFGRVDGHIQPDPKPAGQSIRSRRARQFDRDCARSPGAKSDSTPYSTA
jgi:predicted amidohydrolase YtcJ